MHEEDQAMLALFEAKLKEKEEETFSRFNL